MAANRNRALLIFIGAAFRVGGQDSPLYGAAASYAAQREAAKTHVQFIEFLGMPVDVMLGSYSTAYDAELASWYPGTIETVFHKGLIGYRNLFSDMVQRVAKLNLDPYVFVHFIRIDLALKPGFFKAFKLSPQVRFSSVMWKNHSMLPNGMPRVSDTMLYIPWPLFELLTKQCVTLCHESYQYLRMVGVPDSAIGCYVSTYHDSDSQKDWNPLYCMVNRPRAKVWQSR